MTAKSNTESIRPHSNTFAFKGYSVLTFAEKLADSEEASIRSAVQHYIAGEHPFKTRSEKIDRVSENSPGPYAFIKWRHLDIKLYLKPLTSDIEAKRIQRDFILAQLSNENLKADLPFAFVENIGQPQRIPDLVRWTDAVAHWQRHPELHDTLLEPARKFGERAKLGKTQVTTQKEYDEILHGLSWEIVDALITRRAYDSRSIDAAILLRGTESGHFLGTFLQFMDSPQFHQAQAIFDRIPKDKQALYRSWVDSSK